MMREAHQKIKNLERNRRKEKITDQIKLDFAKNRNEHNAKLINKKCAKNIYVIKETSQRSKLKHALSVYIKAFLISLSKTYHQELYSIPSVSVKC